MLWDDEYVQEESKIIEALHKIIKIDKKQAAACFKEAKSSGQALLCLSIQVGDVYSWLVQLKSF